MFRALASATTFLLVAFATQASASNFDRNLCVTAVFDAGKVTKCIAEAVKMRKEKGPIYSAVKTCGTSANPDRALACANYVVDHVEADIDRPKVRGACYAISDSKADFKTKCLFLHLQLEDREIKEREQASGVQIQAQPTRRGGSAR